MSSSSQFWTPGTARTKTDAQVAYKVRFRCTCYGWKDNFKALPMALVSGPNSSGVDRNRRNKITSRICLGVASPVFGLWAMYRVEPIRGATRGVLHDLNPLLAVAAVIIRLWVLLRFILSRTVVAVHRFMKP